MNHFTAGSNDISNGDDACCHDKLGRSRNVDDKEEEEEEEEQEDEEEEADEGAEVDDDVSSAFSMPLIGPDESRSSVDRPMAEQYSIDGLFANIQELLRMAAENARHREHQSMVEKGKLKVSTWHDRHRCLIDRSVHRDISVLIIACFPHAILIAVHSVNSGLDKRTINPGSIPVNPGSIPGTNIAYLADENIKMECVTLYADAQRVSIETLYELNICISDDYSKRKEMSEKQRMFYEFFLGAIFRRMPLWMTLASIISL